MASLLKPQKNERGAKVAWMAKPREERNRHHVQRIAGDPFLQAETADEFRHWITRNEGRLDLPETGVTRKTQ